MLVTARHVRNLSGRKTDVSDAAWLAQLARMGWCVGRPPAGLRTFRTGNDSAGRSGGRCADPRSGLPQHHHQADDDSPDPEE